MTHILSAFLGAVPSFKRTAHYLIESPRRAGSQAPGTKLLAGLCASLLVAASCSSPAFSVRVNNSEPQPAKVKPAAVAHSDLAPVQPNLFNTTDPTFVQRYLPSSYYMALSEIKPGMKGYGLTVFHGTKIERFGVEVIGVVKNVLNGRDAILARFAGPEMAKTNVIKGMSGSPVYINDRLIGAVSFGYDFSKEPIGGITPIVDMLDGLADFKKAKGSIARLQAPAWGGGAPGLSNTNGSTVPTTGGAPRMVPLVSPVALCGFSSQAQEYLSHRFAQIGMQVTSGSAGGLDPTLASGGALSSGSAAGVQPGSAISVLLSTGDFSIVATGTTTCRFGNRVLAFGHPFMQAGPIDFPMATAHVHQVMPSLSVSFKVASPVAVVGAFSADRPWSCAGSIGKTSKMIPCNYTVVDETRQIQRTYNCQVIDHADLTPDLVASTAVSAIDATHQAAGPYVAQVESRIEIDGQEPLVRTDRFGTESASGLAAFLFGDPIGRYIKRVTNPIVDNEFQNATIKNVKLKITLRDGHDTARIERVYLDKAYAAPGEEVKVTYVIRPYNKEPYEESINFTVPRDVPDGNMPIAVCGGGDLSYIRGRLGIYDPDPESLKQILDKIRQEGRGDQINLLVALPEQSLVIKGTKVVSPPAHWVRVFFSNRHTKGPQIVRGEMRTSKNQDWLLSGSHILTVEVRSRDKALARLAPFMMSSPSSGEDVSMTEQARKSVDSSPGRKGSGAVLKIVGPGAASSQSASAGSSAASASTSTSKAPSASASIIAAPGKEYPHMRPVHIWRQETEEDFRAGKMDNVTADSWGRLGPAFENVAERPVSFEDQIWAGVASGGDFYYSAGDSVWRWHCDNSKPELVAKLDGLFIPALAADNKGTIYASAVPGGKIYALDSHGQTKPQVIFKAPESIICALTTDPSGNLYAGTGSTGKIYKIDPAHKMQVLFDSGQAHVLCLFYSAADKLLYAGTGERGSVYTVDEAGHAKALYQSPDHFVTGVVKDKKGDIYIASSAQGHLVRLLPSGETFSLATSDAFFSLLYDPGTDSVFAGDAEGDITMALIDPVIKQPYFTPVCHTEQEAVLALASDGQKLLAGTSNLAGLRAFRMSMSHTPVYSSVVKDGGRTCNWSRLRAFGPFNEKSATLAQRVQIMTRTGDTATPDETWSSWQPTTFADDSFAIASPAGRYFQYKLSWTDWPAKSDPAADSKLTIGRLDVIYLPRDVAPAISTVSVKAGTFLSGKTDVTLTGTDADGDNLALTIEASSDGGATFKELKSLRSKSAKTEAAKSESTKTTSSSTKDDDGDKDTTSDTTKKDDAAKDTPPKTSSVGQPVPMDKGDKSDLEKKNEPVKPDADKSAEGDKAADKAGDKSAEKKDDKSGDKAADSGKDKAGDKDADKTAKAPSKKTPSGSDKSSSKKGKSSTTTTLKITGPGADSSKNPTEGAASTENFSWSWDTAKQKDGNYVLRFIVDDSLSNPEDHQQVINLRAVTVDNTAPEIELITHEHTKDGKLEFTVKAQDQLSPIANAVYKIDDGDAFALCATQGTVDSLKAQLVASAKVESGTHKLEVKVSDRAGNTATKTINISGK